MTGAMVWALWLHCLLSDMANSALHPSRGRLGSSNSVKWRQTAEAVLRDVVYKLTFSSTQWTTRQMNANPLHCVSDNSISHTLTVQVLELINVAQHQWLKWGKPGRLSTPAPIWAPCNSMSPLIESIKCYFMPKQRHISWVWNGYGVAPTWLRHVSPPRDHFNHCPACRFLAVEYATLCCLSRGCRVLIKFVFAYCV